MTTPTPAARATPLWLTPVITIVAGGLVLSTTFGVRAAFGLFLHPLSHDLGFGRGIFAFAIALQNLIWGIAQPFAGAIADRYGSGRVIALGGVIYAIGVILMSRASDLTSLTIGAGFFVGIGLSGAAFAVVLAAIGRAVPDRWRSMALGIGAATGSIGQFMWVPIGQGLLQEFGWSSALLIMGIAAFIAVPMAAFLTGKARDTAGPRQSLGEALSEARRHPGYLLLNAGFFVCGFQVTFIATHLPAFVNDLGLPGNIAAWSLALVGAANIVGTLAAGYLGGVYSKKYLLSALYFARSMVIIVYLVLPITATSTLVFGAAIGLLWLSTVPLTSSLVDQIFGTRYLATLFGIVFLSHQVGAFLGIWLGGLVFDATGTYGPIWWASVALGILAMLCHWPINERPVVRTATA